MCDVQRLAASKADLESLLHLFAACLSSHEICAVNVPSPIVTKNGAEAVSNVQHDTRFVQTPNKNSLFLSRQIVDKLTGLLEIEASVDALKSTKIGVFVNNLKKEQEKNVHLPACKAIVDACSRVVDKWKSDLKAKSPEKPTSPHAEKRPISPLNGDVTPTAKSALCQSTSESASKLCKSSSDSSLSSDSCTPKFMSTGDAVRDKCIDMLFTALCIDNNVNKEHAMNIAVEIEDELFKAHKSPDAKYKSSFRSKYLNLKDTSNPDLRNAVLYGDISIAHFIQMTPQEMASQERKKEIAELQAQNLFNAQSAKDSQAETDQFKCGKCLQRKCKYYQLQTRSADEPMTTFVTCVNCGNRWKFF